MVEVHGIETFDNPELAPYRTMRRQEDHRSAGIFVAEGEKVVRRLLESPLEVVSLVLPEKWLREYELLLAERREAVIHAWTAEKEVLEELTGFSMYQGVLAVGRVPRLLTMQEAITATDRPRLFVAVDGVSSAENLGGLVRNCVAFGVQAIIASETSCSPWLRRAVRGSMGAIFKIHAIESTSLLDDLRVARESGLKLIAAHPHTDQRTLWQADFRNDCLVVLGSEGTGISEAVLNLCDEAVAIPMQNEVDSLNVGTAGAVFLAEAARQRQS